MASTLIASLVPEAEQIPKFKDAVKPEKAERVNKRIQREVVQPPDNAVPFGLGGQPLPSSVQFSAQGGEGGLSFGEGNFKDHYAWYVQAVKNRISNNWLVSTISPSLSAAPRRRRGHWRGINAAGDSVGDEHSAPRR